MKKSNTKDDPWYSPIKNEATGNTISGAAAMLHRVKLEQGLETIVQKAFAQGLKTGLTNLSEIYKKSFR